MEEPLEIDDWKRILLLGTGAFGVVSMWKHEKSEECIAIKKCKFVSPQHLTANHKRRWENEVNIIKALKHDNIVAFKELPKNLEIVLNQHNPSGLPILSMEYCTKGNLRHVLNQPRNSSGLTEADVREVLSDITGAVSYLHLNKITHRDIKPENIVLQECKSRAISGVLYKLIDLGYAKEISDSNVSFVGTLHYLAPEIMKTESYSHSVDYWSLGVLAFEILCGVLPFLPHFTPFERLQYIEKKEPDVICIYQMRSGTVVYRSEIFKENHINSCLKQHLESWLRHILSYDKKRRSENLPNDTNLFDFIDNVLKKKIVTVFSVYTSEFYSYEINENTFVSTLKDWIKRDIKVAVDEQLLVTSAHKNDIREENFVVDYVTDDDMVVFVYRKGSFIKRDLVKQLPKFINFLFENCSKTFTWRELRPFNTKTLFFITENARIVSFVSQSFFYYVESFERIALQLRKHVKEAYFNVSSLLQKIDTYCNIRNGIFSDILINNSSKYSELLEALRELIESVEKAVRNVNKLLRKNEVFKKRQHTLKRLLPKIKTVVDSCCIKDRINDATQLLTKTSADEQRESFSCKQTALIVSQTLKDQDLLLHNKSFLSYTKAVGIAYKECDLLVDWTKTFCKHVKYLEACIDQNQREQYAIVLNQVINASKSSIVDLDTRKIVQENTELRYEFQNVISEIFSGLTQTQQDCAM